MMVDEYSDRNSIARYVGNWLVWLLTISGNGHESPLASSVNYQSTTLQNLLIRCHTFLTSKPLSRFGVSPSPSPRLPSSKMSHYQLASDTLELILSHYHVG